MPGSMHPRLRVRQAAVDAGDAEGERDLPCVLPTMTDLMLGLREVTSLDAAVTVEIEVPILEHPEATVDHTLGEYRVKGFLGRIDGEQVAVFVYKEGPSAGQLASSSKPSENQLKMWGIGFPQHLAGPSVFGAEEP